MTQHRRIALVQATAFGADWDDGSIADLTLTEVEKEATARVWAWLLGVDSVSPDAARVRREVLRDAGIVVALNLPAAEFLNWFRRTDWEHFDITERTGSEAWAVGLMQRAWAAVRGNGGVGYAAVVDPSAPCLGLRW